MSESTPEPQPAPTAAEPAPRPTLRHAWQIPAAALGTAALIGALVYGVRHAPKPDYGEGLRKAKVELADQHYGDALTTLNTQVLPLFEKSVLTPEQRREFFLLRARSLYLGQKDAGLNRTENHEAIISEYREAEELHAELTPADMAYLSGTHLALGDIEKASALAERLPPSAAEDRRGLLKQMVVWSMDSERPSLHIALDLLTRLSADTGLSDDDRLWVLRRQALLLVQQGYASDAITKIIRTLPRLENAAPDALGEVLVTLAEAYLAADDPRRAGEQLERALGLLGEGHELTPRATRLSAIVSVREGGAELLHAKDRYQRVVEQFASSPERPESLLGLAEVECLLADSRAEATLESAIAHYGELIDAVRERSTADLRDRSLASLLARFASQYDRGDYRTALRFATMAERLCGPDNETADVLASLANTHRELAGEMLTHSGGKGALSLAEVDPSTQREAREHLIKSGAYFRRHAAKVVQTDARAYGESLWSAADAFDRAGDLDASINAFRLFQTDFPSDVRQPEAAFRLAEAYRARGDLALASDLYRNLIAGRASSGPSGPFADASYVPLATTMLTDAEPANDVEAEALLLSVVRGEVGGVSTPMFKGALLELGRHYYRTGQYERAIERLEELRARTGVSNTDSAAIGESFRLADSYRLSAEGIDTALKAAMPDSQRVSMQQTRKLRLDKALALYDESAKAIELLSPRSATDDLRLRNARFYMADCAYGLADYDSAIRFYDAARDAYPKDPASLVAMVQIVSALLAQGKNTEAATANARARRFYESLPESVWDDPTIPMTRHQWETWLDAQARLVAAGESAKSAAAGPE